MKRERERPLHVREWGRGIPVIALHPLGLDSRAFSGIAEHLAGTGYRTIAVDLPGFGETQGPEEPLTPARLAEPVIELAETLETPPVVLGISMGGRVALEAALRAPERFAAVVAIAPYLPWLSSRGPLQLARLMNPDLAARLPLSRIWPALKLLADWLERVPYVASDPIAREGARLIYNMSCPATRWSFISAAREMALDPAFGPCGLWERLPSLAIPTAFFWGGRDRLVSMDLHEDIARTLPSAEQRILPCLSHALNGEHHRCLATAVAVVLRDQLAPARVTTRRRSRIEVRCQLKANPRTRPGFSWGAPGAGPE